MRRIKSVTEEYSKDGVTLRVETRYDYPDNVHVATESLYKLSIGNSCFIAANYGDLLSLQSILKELL